MGCQTEHWIPSPDVWAKFGESRLSNEKSWNDDVCYVCYYIRIKDYQQLNLLSKTTSFKFYGCVLLEGKTNWGDLGSLFTVNPDKV